MTSVALVSHMFKGGVKTVLTKLLKGLREEGFYVRVVSINDINVPFAISEDLSHVSLLKEFDAIIYLGSIAWPSHYLLQNNITGLFIHGFIHHEFLNAIKYEKLRVKLGTIILLSNWFISRTLNLFNFFICHSITACEKNKINNKIVLLPQFVLDEEISTYKELAQEFAMENSRDKERRKIKLLTYMSFSLSSRLLRDIHIISLIKQASSSANREIELIIIDPRITTEKRISFGNLIVRYIGFLPRVDFLKTLYQSDLYIERCIDEEIGYGAIEAGLLGTPVAKITYPKYLSRQDYSDDDIIVAKDKASFIDRIKEYINNIEYYREIYSYGIQRFIESKRTWRNVKKSLIRALLRYKK